ncbi:larval serum protein 2 [Teleopsis dalmanni]|uniref:larval serum protein 2 n=1 Tax=Teleopsis dalmanni TaxID=139649 RepID=UPI0018CE1D55|nr:larval serum protein 2 [Teleopsis dalmanni]
MKSFTAVAVVALALIAFVSSKHIESKYADKDFLVQQKFVLEMLQHIYQDDVFVAKYDDSWYSYKPWEHVDHYNHVDLLKGFFELWQHKPMYDDEIFTVFYDRHEEYALGLSRLFFFAKDWETFTHAVFWARTHVNKQLFIYAFTTASLFRPDMEGIVFPAVYEIHPWHFFDADTLEWAEKYRMHGFHNVKKLDNMYHVVIKSNYSNHYGDVNYDHNMAYFLEDVGLNAFYYYSNLDYPFWTKGPEGRELNKDRRGEFYLYIHMQLLARYYLERLSHDLGEIPQFNMYEHVDSGYFSGLHYYRGVSFPDRDNHYNFYSPENLEYIRETEVYIHRIMEFIDKNKKYDIDVVNTLGNIIQGNEDSIDTVFYGSIDNLYRHIVNEGRPYGKYYETLPSTFMHYETSVRDPLFWEVYKEITHFYWHLVEHFPEYTYKDFAFEGVKIDNVHVPESLTTFFEYFDSDISNAVNVEVPQDTTHDVLYNFGRNSHYDGHGFVIKARQFRLNHKPFEFQLDVTSDKEQHAVVKIFIGPKYDENGKYIHLEDNYMNFVELDHFVVDLVAGSNVVKRNSIEFSWFVNDRTTYLELYQKVMDATHGEYKFPLNQVEAHCGVPQRLMIPKGKKGGMPYQFFFMVYPFHEPAVKQHTGYNHVVSCGVGSGARFVDALPFGFPFNRPVKHDYYFNVDNFKFHDVKIYHKDDTTNVV